VSIQAVAWALEQDIPARPKLVLVSIANHADHRTGYCWLKAETIAEEASCSPRAVFNFVGDLIRNGYLRKELRRGDDGKQRASDYWIMFDREQTEWFSTKDAPADEEPATSSEPDARGACGENDETLPADGPELPACASGPHAPVCMQKDSEEPSKTNPEKRAREVDFAAPPRSYKPPPIAPPAEQGATQADARQPIFVFVGSDAWKHWMVRKKLERRGIDWTLTTRALIKGEMRTGWYFPSLYPPPLKPAESTEEASSTGPPATKTG
jgi:hypothetical protein